MRDAIHRVLLAAVLLTISLYPASAAPPATCAQKFVGSWTVRVNATGQTYPLIVRPNGTSHITCFLCPPEGTWTCDGNTFTSIETSTSSTLSADGRSLTGNCCTITRVGEPPTLTTPSREAAAEPQSNLEKKVAAIGPANSTKATLAHGPLARSKDGQLAAIAIPGAAWCGEVVGIRLEGTPTVVANDPALQKILADTRKAVTEQCPNATGIRFYARGDERSSFHGWSSKADKWAIQELAADSAKPTQPANEKLLREIARIEAQLLNELAGAQQVSFASDAEAGQSHAAWRISNVTLGLTIVDVNQDKPAALSEMVERITRQAAQSCGAVEGKSFSGSEDKVARHTFICRRPPNSYAYGIVAYASGAQLFVLGLYSSNADADNGSNLVSIASAFERIIAADW